MAIANIVGSNMLFPLVLDRMLVRRGGLIVLRAYATYIASLVIRPA